MLMRSQHWAFSALFNAQSCMFLLAWARKVRSRGPMCWWPCTAKKIPMRCITCINKKLPALMWSIICLMGLQRLEALLRPSALALVLRDLQAQDRKSTRLNSSHVAIAYAVFCFQKKTPQVADQI